MGQRYNYNFKDFQAASGESGAISQTYPSTEDWPDLTKYKNLTATQIIIICVPASILATAKQNSILRMNLSGIGESCYAWH